MLHELLLALVGCTGDVFVDIREQVHGPEDYTDALHDCPFRLAPDLAFIQPSEKEIIERLLRLGFFYHELDNFTMQSLNLEWIESPYGSATHDSLDTTSSRKPASVYTRALANGIVEVLAVYRSAVLKVEQDLLSDATPVLSNVTKELNKFETLLPPLHALVQEVKQKNLRGGRFLDLLHTKCHCGVPELQTCMQRLLWHGHQVMYRQLAAWTVYGLLQDQHDEFFIRRLQDESRPSAGENGLDGGTGLRHIIADTDLTDWQSGFQVFLDMLPQYISMQVAESILFVGKAVRILRNPSKSFKSHQRVLELQDAKQASMNEEVLSGNFHAKDSSLEMPDHREPKLLPQSQVEKIALMIQALKEMPDFHKSSFEGAIDSIRTIAATHLWQLVVVHADLIGHLKALKDYFLLAKGDFFQAGNILIDASGAIKLGDFGVSACMFDTGDRQRSRNTFVGTPCWMAPEVLEQVHGYDFKADIWSFGITALELAHGHAPFSKYPPMKVLLMTLQNAPPGLDYERDKRFSKSFKEMIAMCLVKNPAKRPTAEKLLRHSFFKHTRSPDYLVRTVLDGLAPLGQRFRDLKVKDAERLAQKKMPFDVKEERSQNEYKRGVSSWNFDIEDLKAQAASIQDDDGCFAGKEESELTDTDNKGSPARHSNLSLDIMEESNSHPVIPEPAIAGGRPTKQQSGIASTPLDLKSEELVKAMEVHDDELALLDSSNDLSGHVHGVSEVSEVLPGKESRGEAKKVDRLPPKCEVRDLRLEKTQQEGRRASSGPLVPEYVLAAHRNRDEEKDIDRLPSRANDDSFRSRSRALSGPLSSHGAPYDHRFVNGMSCAPRQPTGSKDAPEKGLYVQKKGRFSVTSADVELTEDQVPAAATRRSTSTQALPQLSQSSASTIPTAAVLPYLQNLLNHTVSQQDLLSNLINSIGRGEPLQAQRASDFSSSQRVGGSNSESLEVEISSDREHELLQQVSELQNRLTNLVNELQTLKLRNISLERQLNAIYNKEEEERIRREEEAKEDG